MWAIVVLPPLVVPWGIRRPACPNGCRSDLPVDTHLRRTIPGLVPLKNSVGEVPITEYGTVRFRCPLCRRTVVPELPNMGARSKLPLYLEAEIISRYCLGEPPAHIYHEFGMRGFTVSRPTIFRVLSAIDDEQLRALHATNLRRSRKRRSGASNTWYQGAEIPSCEGDLAKVLSSPAVVLDSDDRSLPGALVTRCCAIMRSLYGDRQNKLTVQWLDQYLKGCGSAGVVTYNTWRKLMAAFPSDEPLYYRGLADDLIVSLQQLKRPLDLSLPPIRNAIKGAVRLATVDRQTLVAAGGGAQRWRDRSGSFILAQLENQDMYDLP
jgi:hypothetical protein